MDGWDLGKNYLSSKLFVCKRESIPTKGRGPLFKRAPLGMLKKKKKKRGRALKSSFCEYAQKKGRA
jgi:hypothetical protein